MADETQVTPDPETPEQEIPEAVCVSKLRLHSAKVYPQRSVDILVQKLEQKIEESGGGGTGTNYKGVVEHESDLATIASSGTAEHGDWYIARDTGKSWVWTVKDGVGDWVQMSSTVDLSNYPTKDDVYLKGYIDGLVNRVTAAETKLNKITTALGELLNAEALVYETYTTDDLFSRYNTILSVLKAAVATDEPEPESQS